MKKPNHFHLQAVSGNIIEHFHTTPGHAHEHDGMRRYATSRKAIEKQQQEYRKTRKAYFKRLAEKADERTKTAQAKGEAESRSAEELEQQQSNDAAGEDS